MPHMPLEFRRFMGSDRPDQYREAMHECLQLAGMTTASEHRAVLVAMAQGWKLLAQFPGLAATLRAPDDCDQLFRLIATRRSD
jgi:hypothetical protein